MCDRQTTFGIVFKQMVFKALSLDENTKGGQIEKRSKN